MPGNVQVHKGKIIDFDMQIRNRTHNYDIYRMVDLLKDKEDVEVPDPLPDPFVIKVNRDVDIFGPVKGSKLGPSRGYICVGELEYRVPN